MKDQKEMTKSRVQNALSTLSELIELLRIEIDPEVPIQQVQVLLQVALMGKATQHEIGERVGLSKASMSRNIAALGPVNRFRQKGHGLLHTYEDPQYRRQKIIELTPAGKTLVKKIESLVERRCQ